MTNMNIKQTIEEMCCRECCEQLINSIIESNNKMKKKTIPNMLQDDNIFKKRGIDGVRGYNKAIEDINTLLKEAIV